MRPSPCLAHGRPASLKRGIETSLPEGFVTFEQMDRCCQLPEEVDSSLPYLSLSAPRASDRKPRLRQLTYSSAFKRHVQGQAKHCGRPMTGKELDMKHLQCRFVGIDLG